MSAPFLLPEWPAPARVRAVQTTRLGGVSEGPYASLNLGEHSGDAPERVAENRRWLRAQLQLPGEPWWLRQVHGREVVAVGEAPAPAAPAADAAVALQPGRVAVVMTADCLPVLFCDRAGSVVAAAHAGWRGLAAGVLEATIAAMPAAPASLMAWMGPAIGPQAFQVGAEVRDAFLQEDAGAHACFTPRAAGKFMADLPGLARRRLQQAGVSAIYGGRWCTHTEAERFYSYRRSPRCGRMASLIWLTP